MSLSMPNLYTRWTRGDRRVTADILVPGVVIEYDSATHAVHARIGDGEKVEMDPDTARMLGVRLIEAATRAEGDSRVRA